MKIVVFLLFIPFAVFSQEPDFTLNQGEIQQKDYFTEIPFEFTKGQIIIKVSIDSITYRFSLDTGAPTSVSDELFTKLNLPVINKLNVIDANNEQDSINVTILKFLNIGDIEIENTAALVLDSDNLIFNCLKLDGNIGSNSLRKSVVQFCYPDKLIKITNTSKNLNLRRRNSQKLEITENQSTPLLWIKLKGKDKGRLQLIFDSGMEGLLNVSLRNFKTFNEYEIFENIKNSKGNNGFSVFKTPDDTLHYRMTIPQMELGKIELQNAIATTTTADNSRIGTKTLEYSIITLDYTKKRIYFTPIGERRKNVFEPTYPMQPNFRNGKLQVGFIWNPEQVPNVQLGDEIISLNGISCQERSICEIMLLMDSLDSEELKIVTQNKDGGKNISTIKKE